MSLEDLYRNYYADEREQQWYEVCAPDKAANILEFSAPLRPHRVLDIGAGNGSVTRRLLEAGLAEEIHAVEISESGLAELTQSLGGQLASIRKFDGLRLPYGDDEFDLAILSHVVEHVEHPRRLLHEARRVARHLYVEVPLEDVPFKSNLHGDFVMDSTGHINYYHRHTIRRLLQTSGWKVLRTGVRFGSIHPYRFQFGHRGEVHYLVKKVVFRILPNFAQLFFVFHGCLICERGEPISTSLGDMTLASSETRL
jgi:SAM-dependent methyltransferase